MGLAVAVLCGTAGRAFADDIPIPSGGQIITLLVVLAALGIGALFLVVRVFMAATRTPKDTSAKRQASAVEPAIPAARVVKDSDPPP